MPTSADVQHYQRELAAEGIVLGAEVLTFNWLVRAIAEATGVRARVLGPVARERVVRAAVADTRLEVLARSAAAPGFAAAAGALFAELGRSLVGPARFAQALRDWPEAPAHAGELAALFSAYHRRLERLGAVDGEGLARAALDALRERPAAWGARPVFLYGFDDLTPLQRDAVETLARHADVCVALAYEPGRAAFADRAATVELLKPLAERHELLEDRSEHYAANARDALHHLERGLFEPAAGRRPPNGAVRLLEAGGERAEAELVAAEILELTGSGVLPEDIAVLVRGGAAEAGVLGQVLESYGVPVSLERRIPLGRTRLGAGVLAGARAALPGGTAADVLTWLRTPGRLADPDAADALEAHVRRAELTTAAEARRAMARSTARPPTRGRGSRRRRRSSRWPPRRATARRRSSTRWSPRRRRSGPRRTGAPRPCSAPTRRPTPARRPRCARRPTSCARLAAADPALAGAPQELLGGARRRAGARAGGRGRGAGRRPARHPRAPLPRRLRLRPAGGRLPAPPDAGAVPRRRRAHLAGPRHRARARRATRTSSRASATCSTRRSRAPRRCCSSPSARPTRRATRCSRRRSSTTSARCSPTSCGRAAGGGCSARSRGRRRRRRRRTSCGARAPWPRSCPSRRRSGRR